MISDSNVPPVKSITQVLTELEVRVSALESLVLKKK